MRIAASMLFLGALTNINSEGLSGRTPLIWAIHVPDVTVPYTASTFTPSEDIAVTRVQAQMEVPGQFCSVNAVITVSNGSASVKLSLAVLANDTGPINASFLAGIPITVSVSSPAACDLAPSWANVVVQYTSRGREAPWPRASR